MPDREASSLKLPVTLETISAADGRDGEPGRLVWVGGLLAALLLRAERGWFLQHGLGPFEAEGIVFDTIEEAEDWVRINIPPRWSSVIQETVT